jgi:hypothetical protein
MLRMSVGCLKRLLREGVGGQKVLRERPWAVEWTFKMSGGIASDSEGEGADGFAIVMRGERGGQFRLVVDAYWNPQTGDQSGNSLKWESADGAPESVYVPHRFDDGKEQRLILSNSPVPGVMLVSHAGSADAVPVTYMVKENPFADEEDVEFDIEKLGNGDVTVDLSRSTFL